jgi:hypothetical protein
MNKRPMTHGKTSRRQFVQLAGGLALALRHGLLPAQARTAAPHGRDPEGRAAAMIKDSALRIEWDANLHARVSRRSGPRWIPVTTWGPGEYLLREGARRSDARRSDARQIRARRTGGPDCGEERGRCENCLDHQRTQEPV